MKICFIFSNIHLKNITAQPKIAYSIAIECTNQGNEVYIISNRPKNLEINNYKYRNIKYLFLNGIGEFNTYFLNTLKIINYIVRNRIEVIFVQGYLLMLFIWPIARILNKPLYCSICEILEAVSSKYSRFIIFCLNRVSGVFVTSNYIKKQLISNGLKHKRIYVVRIGLKEMNQKNKLKVKKMWDVLYFGDSSKERGFDIIYHIAKILNRNIFKVIIRNKINCIEEIAILKKMKNVSVSNTVSGNELENIIKASKVVLLPFRWMGVTPPLSIVECMSLGACVITSNIPGVDEIIENEQNGIILDFIDIKNSAMDVKYYINNSKIRDSIGKKAKVFIREKYNKKEYENIIKIITNHNGKY